QSATIRSKRQGARIAGEAYLLRTVSGKHQAERVHFGERSLKNRFELHIAFTVRREEGCCWNIGGDFRGERQHRTTFGSIAYFHLRRVEQADLPGERRPKIE